VLRFLAGDFLAGEGRDGGFPGDRWCRVPLSEPLFVLKPGFGAFWGVGLRRVTGLVDVVFVNFALILCFPGSLHVRKCLGEKKQFWSLESV